MFIPLRNAIILIIGFVMLAGFTNAPVATDAISSKQGFSDSSSVRLKVGEAAPNFSLMATNGKTVSLTELKGSPVMLIFFRGAWCPFCVSHMEDITTVLPELEAKGVEVVAISPDDIANLKTMAGRLNNPYTFLSDPKLVATNAYGVQKNSKLPHPSVVIVDAAGVVQWFYVGEDYKTRPSSSQVLKVVNRIMP